MTDKEGSDCLQDILDSCTFCERQNFLGENPDLRNLLPLNGKGITLSYLMVLVALLFLADSIILLLPDFYLKECVSRCFQVPPVTPKGTRPQLHHREQIRSKKRTFLSASGLALELVVCLVSSRTTHSPRRVLFSFRGRVFFVLQRMKMMMTMTITQSS